MMQPIKEVAEESRGDCIIVSFPGGRRSFHEPQASDGGGRNHEADLDKTGTFSGRRSHLPGHATILGSPDPAAEASGRGQGEHTVVFKTGD